MAGIAAVIHILEAGDHAIVCDDCYGGTYRLFSEIMARFSLEFTFLRLDDEEKIIDAIKLNTKLIWIETPSNPLLNITDLELVSKIAKEHNILTVADNTFSSPYFLKPIDFGIDIVLHSTTKYINGYSDVIGGAVITTDELAEKFTLTSMDLEQMHRHLVHGWCFVD